MRCLLPQLRRWHLAGERFVLATVVRTEGSSPRVPGECLIASADGSRFFGAVSSGCLDNEVIETAGSVLEAGGARTLHFGPDGVPPWSEGLSCGGRIEVRVEPWWGCSLQPETRAVADLVLRCLEEDRGCAVLSRGDSHCALDAAGNRAGDAARAGEAACARALALLDAGAASASEGEGAERVFIRLIHPRRRLLLVGAADLAVRLTPLARAAGLRVTVLDPRRAYAAPARFEVPPDELLCGWPEEFPGALALGARDAAVVLSHDPKIDDAALVALLGGGVGYLGALGSATSHARRLERLRERGVEESLLRRIEGPAGVRLGQDADAVALGILAGVVRGVRRGAQA